MNLPTFHREPLVDAFGRRHTYLRISLTDRCNFRCVYCMPPEGVEWGPRETILSLEEIYRLSGLFAELGITKVRLTGGEPTIRKGFLDLVGHIASTPGIEKVLVTTNGSRLAKQARDLRERGLSGVTISLDSLNRSTFAKITRTDSLDVVLEGIDAALEAGIPTIKLNTVVMAGHNEGELLDLVEFVRDRPVQVRFIEFMPFAGNRWSVDRVIGYREMRETIERRYTLTPLPGQPSDVAKEFFVEGMQGTVGFITSVTDSFCGGCNRVRLTADGRFKTCLFLPPRTSLRDLMREGATDEQLVKAIRDDLGTKWAGHPPMDRWEQLDTLSMVEIGG